jgi:hypothetical protein
MGIESELTQAFMGLFKGKSSIMVCGGNQSSPVATFFYLLLFFLIILLLRSYIVKVAYNHVMPTLIYSVKGDKSYEETMKGFNEISYVEALLLVILCTMLFSRA